MRERKDSVVEVHAAIVGSGHCLFASDDGHWVLFGWTPVDIRSRIAFGVGPACLVVTVIKETP